MPNTFLMFIQKSNPEMKSQVTQLRLKAIIYYECVCVTKKQFKTSNQQINGLANDSRVSIK